MLLGVQHVAVVSSKKQVLGKGRVASCRHGNTGHDAAAWGRSLPVAWRLADGRYPVFLDRG